MSKDLFNNESGAVFSNDRKYRYVLWRIWDDTKPKIMFIGLNPSTASEDLDDPTIRRVKRFAADWGYGGVYMTNLFGIVSPDPSILIESGLDIIGDNDRWLIDISGKCEAILFAWGAFQEAEDRAKRVVAMFEDAICLGVNKNGSPKHPLYIPASTKPVAYSLIDKFKSTIEK